MSNSTPAILFLEDGRFFRGLRFGADGETSGELCFNTGMTGYQEILTDPSYCGQIVTMTSPHIGNYGINPEDVESDRIQVAGFVIKEETLSPSNWRSTKPIGTYLRENGIVGVQGIDTRALTKHLRTHGTMNGVISTVDFDPDSLMEKVRAVPSMTGLNLVEKVTCKKSISFGRTPGSKYPNAGNPGRRPYQYNVAVLDLGVKRNILRLLEQNGCRITLYPATTSANVLLSEKPDGIFLSNGPGDPAAVTPAIDTVKKLLGKAPILGICLGHQLLALALGARTYKLKFGHRGLNHPVKRLATGRVEITSQNHGFAVGIDSLPENVELTHINLSDNTLEGLRCKHYPAFSVQYHPEASPGPHDSRHLFQEFIALMAS